MSARIGVAVMASLLLLYIVVVGQLAWVLVASGDAVAIAMGIALAVLPLIALWAGGREIWFGVRAARLGRMLESDGELPDESVTVRPSGRIVREDAQALFPRYREAAERHPDDWRSWYRLGLAYDAAGDRRRAREAIRRAIQMESAAARS